MVGSILPAAMTDVVLRRQGRSILGPLFYALDGAGITVVMGPNGAGKTSFLRALHGLERVSRGTVSWAADAETARKRQAFVFQAPTLLRRNVLDNIAYPLILDGTPRNKARDRARALAGRVGLAEMVDRPARVLSGGEKQKMAIARAMIREPELLLLDEPCASLDGHSTQEIEAILLAARDSGTRIVMSTHNVGQARRLAGDVLFFYRGRIHEAASHDRFFPTPATEEARAYLNGDLLP